MLYPKNVPNAERMLRIVLGGVQIGFAIFRASNGPLISLGVILPIISAIVLITTGFIGWCPACAMVGRKLKVKPLTRHEN